jgi:hypothetical protein
LWPQPQHAEHGQHWQQRRVAFRHSGLTAPLCLSPLLPLLPVLWCVQSALPLPFPSLPSLFSVPLHFLFFPRGDEQDDAGSATDPPSSSAAPAGSSMYLCASHTAAPPAPRGARTRVLCCSITAVCRSCCSRCVSSCAATTPSPGRGSSLRVLTGPVAASTASLPLIAPEYWIPRAHTGRDCFQHHAAVEFLLQQQ